MSHKPEKTPTERGPSRHQLDVAGRMLAEMKPGDFRGFKLTPTGLLIEDVTSTEIPRLSLKEKRALRKQSRQPQPGAPS